MGQLDTQITRGQALQTAASLASSDEGLRAARDEFLTWEEYCKTLLSNSFTTSTIAREVGHPIYMASLTDTFQLKKQRLEGSISTVLRKIRSIRDRLTLFPEADVTQMAVADRIFGDDIFLIHGHDEARKQEVARVVGQLTGSEPTILHEMQNGGRTVIEKFENYAARAGFAIALLTPDDHGSTSTTTELRSRARQNVVYELGFFHGALGRGRVVALVAPGIEMPSDIAGVIYLQLSDPEWKLHLAREMRAVGLKADSNNLR